MAHSPVFTVWDFLDPASMRAKLKTAHGSDVWTNDDMLDPASQERKINALHGGTFTNAKGINDTKWTPLTLAVAIGSI